MPPPLQLSAAAMHVTIERVGQRQLATTIVSLISNQDYTSTYAVLAPIALTT
jgi:hypothetical protein